MTVNPVSKLQAIKRAEDEFRSAFSDRDLGIFNMEVNETPEQWRVEFNRANSLEDGQSQHFAVWVDKETGKTEVFKGR